MKHHAYNLRLGLKYRKLRWEDEMPKVSWEEIFICECDEGLKNPDPTPNVEYAHTEGYSLMHRPFASLKQMMGD